MQKKVFYADSLENFDSHVCFDSVVSRYIPDWLIDWCFASRFKLKLFHASQPVDHISNVIRANGLWALVNWFWCFQSINICVFVGFFLPTFVHYVDFILHRKLLVFFSIIVQVAKVLKFFPLSKKIVSVYPSVLYGIGTI